MVNVTSEIQSEQYEVSKMPIRANWLISTPRKEYEITLTQAFIYLFAEKDYQFSIKSKFPVKMQQKLKDLMATIKSEDYKEEVKKNLKVKWKKQANISTFEKEVKWITAGVLFAVQVHSGHPKGLPADFLR